MFEILFEIAKAEKEKLKNAHRRWGGIANASLRDHGRVCAACCLATLGARAHVPPGSRSIHTLDKHAGGLQYTCVDVLTDVTPARESRTATAD